ncbi:MAG: serine/threonine-protein kinase [Pirellulaceae bacterium]
MESGTLLNERYRVVREIGKGCFGVVYLAEEVESGELLAVKVLVPWVKHDETLQRRLRREAKLARQLQNEHVVRVYDDGTDADGHSYLVMEYLQGRQLNEAREAAGELSIPRTAAIAKQILAALQEAHSLGVLHRDLKPSNIFLIDRDGSADFVKVFDFGIAKVMRNADVRASVELTAKGTVLGTPSYMSPEQCAGSELSPASDLYSLAIMLYELLTGSLPFSHKNPVQVLMMHSTQPPPPLPLAIASTHLGKAVMRALAKEPRQRFASADEFSRAIDGVAIPIAGASPAPVEDVPEPTPRETSVFESLMGFFRRKQTGE